MSFATALRWLKTSSAWTSRALAWTLVVASLACALIVLALRYWVLPNIESYRDDIAAAVSRTANVRIAIGKIAASWHGIRPHLKLEQVIVYDKSGRPALELGRVDSTLAWRSLATLRPHFHALAIYNPALEIRRDANGVISVAGIELDTSQDRRGGFGDWLLAQREVEINGATVSWTDELRRAPRLELTDVTLRLVNRGDRHRFALRAQPPAELAAPLDLRGDLRGRSVEAVTHWNGKLFLQLDDVELAAFGAWIDIPAAVTRGAGAVRTWLTFEENELAEIVADVRLARVNARLRRDLPQLELNALTGRVTWRQLPSGLEFSATKLALSGEGAELKPADIRLRMVTDKQGARQGELQADAVDLVPLAMIADRLPLDNELRSELVAFAPRGRLYDVAVTWKGGWPNLETYSARGRFEALAIKTRGVVPGVSGISGNVDGNEKGGTLHVTGERAGLDMPRVFASALALDTLTAQVAWGHGSSGLQLKLNNVSFGNADAAGTFFGTYRFVPDSKGEIDLTGHLTRADARNVVRYIPITVMKNARPWFERAFVAGNSNDVRFRVKGRLDDFPFVQEKAGLFHALVKVAGGTIEYGEKWPRIENIAGDLQFRGSRMDFVARQATIYGVKLSKVQGEIPDMKAIPEVLTVTGEAEGATSDFLAFIARSPVADMIDRFTDGMQAQGSGRLGLKLTLPLGELSNTRLAGTFELINNNITFERDVPPLDHANGRIEFTESSVRAPAVTGVLLGGPVTITAATQRDSVMRATLQGRINADNLRKAGNNPWLQYVRGSTEWRGVLTMRRKIPELVIESNLQGITSMLPEPFRKTATETVQLRLERRFTGAQQDRVSLAYGDLVRAELARRLEGKEMTIERGAVRFGGGAAGELDRPGVWVRGTLKQLDVDEWLAVSRAGEGEGGGPMFAGADVKLGEVDFFGRRFSDLALTMTPQSGVMQLAFTGRDIEGAATWRGENKGRLIARLKKLALPATDVTPAAASPKPPAGKPAELPALDIVVEQFQHGQKQLGRLELNAVHQDRDWRIEKLRLSNPDSTVTADGTWRAWQTQPRTELNVRMDVTDVGRTLARWGYAASVRRGTAKIEGNLGWSGSPQNFDYPTLSGQLVLEAANGQFIKLEPGIAKLLGILSLQALPRRITLDFRDVFSEGLAFDSIIAALKIERGVMSTQNLRIQGPSTRVAMAGEVDLARETQKLRVRVAPHVSDSVSIAGALIGGPVAGIAAYLAQKILKDPLEQLVSFDYSITGTWSDPQVAKAERPATPLPEAVP